jgi:hypothetical protein
MARGGASRGPQTEAARARDSVASAVSDGRRRQRERRPTAGQRSLEQRNTAVSAHRCIDLHLAPSQDGRRAERSATGPIGRAGRGQTGRGPAGQGGKGRWERDWGTADALRMLERRSHVRCTPLHRDNRTTAVSLSESVGLRPCFPCHLSGNILEEEVERVRVLPGAREGKRLAPSLHSRPTQMDARMCRWRTRGSQ